MVGVYDHPRIPWSSHVQVEVATGDQTSDTEVQLMSASPPCVLLGPSYLHSWSRLRAFDKLTCAQSAGRVAMAFARFGPPLPHSSVPGNGLTLTERHSLPDGPPRPLNAITMCLPCRSPAFPLTTDICICVVRRQARAGRARPSEASAAIVEGSDVWNNHEKILQLSILFSCEG